MGSYTPKPDYGRRLLPTIVDDTARDDPDRAAFSVPRTDSDLSQGYIDVSYATFANAVDQLAWLIEVKLGRSENFEAMAYLGAPDIRYHCMQMAAIKTGYQVLFSSHSNSPAGHIALMEKCDVGILLSASGIAVDDILEMRPMKHVVVPELDDLIQAPTGKHYPYNKTFEEAESDPYLILHTSGTTGFPKPIRWTLGAMACLDARRGLPDVDENSGSRRTFAVTHPPRQRILVPFLHFHGVASVAMTAAMLFGEGIYVNGFRHKILERHDLFNVLDNARVDTAFLSPALIEDLASHPESKKYLQSFQEFRYGGAALNHAAAQHIAQYTTLYDQYGTTENMNMVDLVTDAADYDYCAFDLESCGLEFRQVSEDIHEMIFHRTPKSYRYMPFFHREPNETICRPGDLWSPHPDPKKAQYTWKFRGRDDDLITYQDGNNFQPTAYELKYSEHELIRTACLTGTGHRQPVLVVELTDPSLAGTPDAKAQTIDKLWRESISPINEEAPKNGQVAKTHIVIATAEKPFERNVKGTVARKPTLKKYDSETEDVYRQYGDHTMDVTERFGSEQNRHNYQ